MRALRNTLGILCLAAALAGPGVAPAAAAPSLGLELVRDPSPGSTPVHHGDERLVYQMKVTNTAVGVPAVGDLLTCLATPADGVHWMGNPAPSFTFRWLRSGQPIPGETGHTYTATPEDAGKALQCVATGASDPGGSYAPISASAASLPPTVIEPLPTPAPPAGTERPVVSSGTAPAAPTGTATTKAGSNVLTEVIGVEGTGTLTAGSKTVTNVSIASGGFVEKQIITGTGIPTATGSGTFTPHSSLVTGVTTDTGAFVAGEQIGGTGTALDGTEITAVGPGTLEVEFNNSASGPVSFAAHTRIKTVATDTLELSAAATASGPQALAAGPQPFRVGQIVSGPGIPPGTEVTKAPDQGGTLARAVVISNVATASASGVEITGSVVVTCSAPSGWTGSGLTWSLQWLRNGVPIPGETGAAYTVQKADVEPPSSLECEATVEDVAGNKAVAIAGAGRTEPSPPPPYASPAAASATIGFANKTEGPVTVEIELPGGAETRALSLKGGGWVCLKEPPSPPPARSCDLHEKRLPGPGQLV